MLHGGSDVRMYVALKLDGLHGLLNLDFQGTDGEVINGRLFSGDCFPLHASR